MDVSDEEVWCECSDEEMYNPGKEKKGTWQPKPEDILKLLDEVKAKKVLELKWKCPGRRHPDSDKKSEEKKEDVVTTPTKNDEPRPTVPNEFDFDEDMQDSKTVLIPRKTPGSAPRPDKKVARMSQVIKDMQQQRKQQAAEREARKLANARSPRTPGSPARARIGSPAGSPRTPPASSLNRHSPVRAAGPVGDPITTTPLRAPLDSHHLPSHLQDNEKPSVHGAFKSDSLNYGHSKSPMSASSNTSHGAMNYGNSKSPVSAGHNNAQAADNSQASLFSQSQIRNSPMPSAESGGNNTGIHAMPGMLSRNAINTTDKVESMDTNS